MIYEGKISFKHQKIILVIIALLLFFFLRNLIIVYTFMFLYLDILLCQKLSNAKIINNKISIKRHYFFGLVYKSYELFNPQQILQSTLSNLPEDIDKFNIESLDKKTKCKITFYKSKKGN